MKTINTPTQEAQRNIKKTVSRFFKIKFLKTCDKEKILEVAIKKQMHNIQRNKDNDDRLLTGNNATEKIVG